MVNNYDVFINGKGHYKVEASIYKVPLTDTDLECEVEIISIKKFEEFTEEYEKHDADEEELTLIEREVAIQFFKNLH